jgi:HK97 family phage prohead protease
MEIKLTDKTLVIKLDNPLEQCRLKFASDDKGEFEGYASVFNSNDHDNDTMLPGAFKSSIGGFMPKMFINHDHRSIPVGDWTSMKEDDYGLLSKGKIDMNHIDGPSLYSAMKRGAMDGISVGFTMTKDDYTEKEGGGRVYHNLTLREASIVSFPCEEMARISAVKSEMEQLTNLREFERYLRDAGMSGSEAKTAASLMMKFARREVEQDQEADNTAVLSALNELKNFRN